jgi:hypothetical protein
MKFNEMIERVMSDVREGSDKSFLLHRSNDEWGFTYTRDAQGKHHDWLGKVMENDPFAVKFKGRDFANFNYDKVSSLVLGNRLRQENDVERPLHKALVNFFFNNMDTFSLKVMDYLTTVNRPLALLHDVCPLDLTTNHENWSYNQDLAADAIKLIEDNVGRIIANQHLHDSRKIEGYDEKFCVELAGHYVVLADNVLRSDRYAVNDFNMDNDGQGAEQGGAYKTSNYHEALREFITRVDGLLTPLEKEQLQEVKPEKAAPDKKLTLHEKLERGKEMAREAGTGQNAPGDKSVKRGSVEVD